MHIEPRELSQYPWYLRLLFARQRRVYGAPLVPAMLWARVPRLFLRMAWFFAALDRSGSPIPADLRSLVMVRVSQINHCPFCIDLNQAALEKRGVAHEKAMALSDWRESKMFDERERAVLDYAEAVTLPDRSVDDAMMERLKRHFDDDAIIEITALIAFQNLPSKFNAALGVPSQGFCVRPAR